MTSASYHRPASLTEAVKLVAGDSDARLLAGGQSVLPSVRLGLLAPSAFVDLASIADLQGIRVAGKAVVIGAMTTHADVAGSREVHTGIPALAALAGGIGDRQVRNRGTLGGALANSDPAADYPAAALGLDANIRTNSRTITADEYFKGLFETALKPGEIIAAVSFPVPDRAAYAKFLQPASRFALVGVFVAQFGKSVRVAVTGAGACAFRVKALEDALTKNFAPGACDGVKVPATKLNSDIHGSAEYRAHLIPILTRRAVQQALG